MKAILLTMDLEKAYDHVKCIFCILYLSKLVFDQWLSIGLWGCLLFLLVIDGLSLKIAKNLFLSHILFVDDVLLASSNCVIEWECYQNIIKIFCRASGMKVSFTKSCFYHNLLDDNELTLIQGLMPFNACKMVDELKYLGYFLKLNGYLTRDWQYWQ